jgi:hypothetical protein
MDKFAQKWTGKYPAAVKLRRSAWGESIAFLDYDVEICKIICRHEHDRVLERPPPARGTGSRGTSRTTPPP